MRLIRLILSDFRSYHSLTWYPWARISVLVGPNGSGKTNLLEAVSLLTPGRGLRGARMADLARHGATGGWAVAGRFSSAEGETDIGTGTAPEGGGGRAGEYPEHYPGDRPGDHRPGDRPGERPGDRPSDQPGDRPGDRSGNHHRPGERRVFRLDGEAPRSQAEIAARVAAVWLTPQMDRLFQEALSGRRRFLDRLVWALEPGHAREIAAHDSAMAQRNRLLAEGRTDPAWLAGLEDAMARHAVAATASRATLVAHLNATLAAGAAEPFPAAHLALVCPIAERLEAAPALEVEDWLRAGLAGTRARDAAAGSAALGAHRTDLAMSDAATRHPAALASTGEQKTLLVGLILGHAALIAEARGTAPLLLLDEPAVHLDPERRAALFAALARLPAQTLITGTDAGIFAPLRGAAELLRTGEGKLLSESEF
jgi:DNA replication and repair protein RecF